MQMEELSAGHGVLKAARAGHGRDFVVFHSLFMDRYALDAVLPALAEKFRVTLFDLPGFHGSEPAMLPLMDAYLARLEDGFQEFEIAPDAILFGNGFGGVLALSFAIHHPERIGKLILCGAAAAFSDDSRRAFRAMAEEVARGGIAAVAESAAKQALSPDYLAQHPQALDACKQALIGIDPAAFRAACTILAEADLVPLLHKLEVPTLVICGARDTVAPPALSREIADKVTSAHYVELPGCGHCPPLEAPQQFLAAIRSFAGL